MMERNDTDSLARASSMPLESAVCDVLSYFVWMEMLVVRLQYGGRKGKFELGHELGNKTEFASGNGLTGRNSL